MAKMVSLDEVDGTLTPEPIAIVGMAFRFPQEGNTTNGFWNMLSEKQCAVAEFPSDRFKIDSFWDNWPEKLNKISTRSAHFLAEDVKAFDAAFFSIPPREAGSMDPQQRWLLEATYHALENAGISMESAAGSRTSVHIGCFGNDFMNMNLRDAQQIPRYSATGSSGSILANRLSWFYNLQGPSMYIDTACSSGLVALELACKGLWDGSNEMAISGAANLLLTPELNISLSNMNFLSSSGRCHSFDSRASGYGRGEGYAVFVLKPLSKALQSGDPVRAVIRAIGTNQDGRSVGGITQPNAAMQLQLIRETYAKAGLTMKHTRFFEAHGTGTSVGDPLEAQAIGEAFMSFRTPDEPLYVGAVKGNIGHLEAAAGPAGIVKTILALEQKTIPPNANFETLNPAIDAGHYNLKFPTEACSWPKAQVLRASVNAFGFGGTNAHVVLDRFDLSGFDCDIIDKQQLLPLASSSELKLLVLSAADKSGPMRQAQALSEYAQDQGSRLGSEALDDLVYTINNRRSALVWKSWLVLDSTNGVSELFTDVSAPCKSLYGMAGLTMIFTGQGAQWRGMACELLHWPIFLESIQRSDSVLRSLECAWSIQQALLYNAVDINDPEYSQTISTAVQIGLVDITRYLSLVPSVVVGHSSGEIAAGYCAGFLSQVSAMKIAYFRGVLTSKLARESKDQHGMVSVGLSHEEAITAMSELDSGTVVPSSELTVSCINSTTNVTISGPNSILLDLISKLRKQGIFTKKLPVSVGYHSPQMRSIAKAYAAAVMEVEQGDYQASTRMLSSVTAEFVSAADLCSPSYWVENMVSPVRFATALEKLISGPSMEDCAMIPEKSHTTQVCPSGWLEIGPHFSLKSSVRDLWQSKGRVDEMFYSSLLVRSRSAIRTCLAAFGTLCCHGFSVDIPKVSCLTHQKPRAPRVLTNLPPYPFNHKTTYWEESSKSRAFRLRSMPNHDLLGSQDTDWNSLDARWRFIINTQELPWTKDHKVNGKILYPAAGMIAAAIEAIKRLAVDDSYIGFNIRDTNFLSPIVVPETFPGAETQITMRPMTNNRARDSEYRFRIYMLKDDDSWEEACHGYIQLDYGSTEQDVDVISRDSWILKKARSDLDMVSQSCTHDVRKDEFYERIGRLGLEYGLAFQTLSQIRSNYKGFAISRISPGKETTQSKDPAHSQYECLTIHPATLDGVFQLNFIALDGKHVAKRPTLVPKRLTCLWISRAGIPKDSLVGTHAIALGKKCIQASTSILNSDSSQVLGILREFESTEIENESKSGRANHSAIALCYRLERLADLDLLDKEEIMQYCSNFREQSPEPEVWYSEMRSMLLSFAAQSIRRVTWPNDQFVPSMSKYVSWMQTCIENYLDTYGKAGRSARESDLLDHRKLADVCEKMEKTNIRGKLFVKIGKNLESILTGDVSPLELLFGGESMMPKLYEEMNRSSKAFAMLAGYLACVVHKRPELKFLEVGAGTGATTAEIMKVLQPGTHITRYGQYVFTDISPSFFPESYANGNGRITYKTLNIEKDPIYQGYEAQTYDVVIAANVLHATRSLLNTLSNVRKLLKPGGKLIMLELTAPKEVINNFVFGLLPGWWLGVEDFRQQGALINESQWEGLLKQQGFSGLDQVFRDWDSDICHGWSIIVSTACSRTSSAHPTENIEAQPATVSPPTLIIEKSSELQLQVAMGLRKDSYDSNESSLPILALQELSDVTLYDQVIFMPSLRNDFLANINAEDFKSLKVMIAQAKSLLWISAQGDLKSSEPYGAMADGFFRVLRNENNALDVVTVSLEERTCESYASIAKQISRVLKSMNATSRDGLELEYTEVDGYLQLGRLTQVKDLDDHIFTRTVPALRMEKSGNVGPLAMDIRVPGLLDTLEFSEDMDASKPLGEDEIEVKIKATGVNFKECLTLLGRVSSNTLGTECAGIVTRTGPAISSSEIKSGDRVVLGVENTYRTLTRARASQVVKLPANISFVQAAAMPANFCTAYFSLIEVARLQKEETVLIHAAAGGTGQAAIQIAKRVGAEIFATVSTKAKKDHIVTLYGIADDHIFYSRDSSFADGIKRMTKDRGVDVVLNSLSGKLLVASWECIAPFGRFIEIGRKDVDSRGQLPMYPFKNNATFSGVDLTAFFDGQYRAGKRIFEEIMSLLQKGLIHPASPLEVFPLDQVENAFRSLQSGKSSGKIVVEMSEEAVIPVHGCPPLSYRFSGSATFVIAGGTGGIGRQIARWLVSRGAKHILILGQTAPALSEKRMKMLRDLRDQGVEVQHRECNIGDHAALETALRVLQDMPPVKGCFQAAMALRDVPFSRMEWEDWKSSIDPKVHGSWNLHSLLPSGMDFFVFLSSAAGIIGNPGQSNYAAGNTFQDALARYRLSIGEKAASIDLGLILGEGFFADNKLQAERLMRMDVLIPLTHIELFAIFDYYCNPDLRLDRPSSGQLITGIELPAIIRSKGREVPTALQRPLFRCMHEIAPAGVDPKIHSEFKQDLGLIIKEAKSAGDAGLQIAEASKNKLCRILGVAENDIQIKHRLESLGVDSLVALELKNWLVRDTLADIAVFEILGGASLLQIGEKVAQRSQIAHRAWND